MGEAACLRRSFSQPPEISSFGIDEAVPLRGLTESVSFGRFKSESLAWEKYSAFSQNRYLEEVERFTKPGSVAEKRAFFEAHFKKRAAGRATQTKMEERNVTTTNDETICESLKDNLMDSEVPVVVDPCVAMNEEVSNAEMDSVGPSISEMDETNDVQTGEMKDISVENFSSKAVPEGEALNEVNFTSSSRERRLSSSESKACRRSSKLAPSFVEELDLLLKKTRKEPPSNSKRPSSVSKKQIRSPSEPSHRSIKCSATAGKGIVGMPKNSTSAKDAGKVDKKKTSGPSSVHMSLNSYSSVRKTTKRAQKPLARNSVAQETTSSNRRNSAFVKVNEPMGASKGRKRPLPKTTKEDSSSVKCSTRASVARLPELPLNNRLSENKRKTATVGSSVSCRIPSNVKSQPSSSCEKLPTHSRTRTRSVTVSTPFNFRSDERAEKRKEFFKKIEEKNKKEQAGKEQLSCSIKVPLVSPSSPRLRNNKTPGSNNRNKSHPTPLKSCKIHPSYSETKKRSRENQSPNIP